MRWKCEAAYDGTEYAGWQSQPNGNAVQDFIERRLAVIFERPVRIHGAGRTDSGVHARGQVFHFDGDWPHGAARLLVALRVGFPRSLQIVSIERVDESFHARLSAVGKRYRYAFYTGHASPFEYRYYWSIGRRRPDIEAMNRGAAHLIGEHDFSAFGANPRDGRRESPVKTLSKLEVTQEGPRIFLETEGSGYLYRMVRSLAGCLLDVGIGKLRPEQVEEILTSRHRTSLVATAPADGLSLEKVFYPEMDHAGVPPDRAVIESGP
jgi:tRNA pseudouridine38-40 synthase